MHPVLKILVIVGGVLAAGWGALRFLAAMSRRPDGVGVVQGRLAECPGTPNCVSTQTVLEKYRLEPFRFEGSAEAAWARLRRVVDRQTRATILTATDDYLYLEFRTFLCGFVDDVEFRLVPEENAIHFRSASRLGRSDLGVNRSRMESIRRAFDAEAER